MVDPGGFSCSALKVEHTDTNRPSLLSLESPSSKRRLADKMRTEQCRKDYCQNRTIAAGQATGQDMLDQGNATNIMAMAEASPAPKTDVMWC